MKKMGVSSREEIVKRPVKVKRRFQAFALIVVACAATAATPLAQTPQPAPGAPVAGTASTIHTPAPISARREKLPGLPNFARVNKQLLRGGQPTGVGFEELKKLGVGVVVNLYHEPEGIARERSIVQSLGMQYVSLPWRGSNEPNPKQIAEFLELLRANPDKQVFVHCQRGAERTGVMAACYRISVDRWTAQQALDEMEQFGFRGLRFRHLKKFVRDFPALLLNDPLFKQ